MRWFLGVDVAAIVIGVVVVAAGAIVQCGSPGLLARSQIVKNGSEKGPKSGP